MARVTTRPEAPITVLTLLALLCAASTASAEPALRVQMDVQGDFLMFGNTLVHECDPAAPAVPDPVVGTVGNCPNDNPYAPDVYWRADEPDDGSALADDGIAPEDARSTAVLDLPSGAEVVYARLYWGSYDDTSEPDDAVRVQRTGAGLDTMVMADDSVQVDSPDAAGRFWYQSTADITALVQAQGEGPYRIAGVSSLDIVGLGDTNPVDAWYVLVLYELDGEPSRNLAIFDGLDLIDPMVDGSVSVALSGFLVPAAGFDAKLGVVAYEGEAQLTGDALSFNGTTLSNAVNPADNFFNATRSNLGSALTVVGDLPQLSGGPRSLSNLDLDVIDVSSLVTAGDTSATIEATSTLDVFLLASFVTSVSTYKPEFVDSTKDVQDLDGGAVRPGDELQYTIEAINTGSDVAIDTVVTDELPDGVTYVAGSLEITGGANAGDLTDASGDDQGEYDSGSRTVTVRIGDGADGADGGELAIGESTTFRFRVTVDQDAAGTIENQAVITALGQQGAPSEATPTDGNGVDPGQPPTEVVIDACQADADCAAPEPFCDIASSPRVCVACLTSANCTSVDAPDCNVDTHVCECTGGGSCTDTDGDGISDAGEDAIGSDPNDADTDDDGVPDGSELAPDKDSDGDGLANVLDPDSDDDGLFDGTELGFGCDDDATDAAAASCRADGDDGATTTNPVDPDTDDGGAGDGSEDFDLDGVVDDAETDPTVGHGDDDDDVTDSDDDGLSDALEERLHSDPDDADSDDDGALDGEEANPSADGDGDRLPNVLDVDSDDDGLFDGTELGKPCNRDDTDQDAGHCRADNDGGATTTSPVRPDSDGGGVSDGSEDANLNGVVDASETDPTAGNDEDDDDNEDSDGDGLSDALEAELGTDPEDADSDDDGALDGEEANPSDDHDGDGDLNALDVDSDDDGLFDGTERGKPCDRDATDQSAGNCVADEDMGATRTSPVNDDTDYGGREDGDEDTDHDGFIDPEEGDPNDPRDDKIGEACASDPDCGGTDSGVVCEANVCAKGCRGSGGNGCPEGLECSSTTSDVGLCEPAEPGTDGGVPEPDGGMPDAGMGGRGGAGGGGGTGGGGAPDLELGTLGGGGCDCRAGGGGAGGGQSALPIGLALWLLVSRRRRARYSAARRGRCGALGARMTSRTSAWVSIAVLLVGLGTACDPSDDGADAGSGGGEAGGGDSVGDAGGDPEPDAGDAGDAAVVEACPEPTGDGTAHQGVIDADETWTLEDSPHVISADLSIQGSTVTIEACVVVRLQEGLSITIGGTGSDSDSALVAKGEVPSVANGERHRPVRFVAAEGGTHWGSIHVLESGRVDLEVVVLEHGGAHATAQNYGGTLVASGGGGPDLERIVRTVNVRVLDSEGFGVNLQSFAAFTEDSRDLVIEGAGQTPSPSNIVTDYPLFIAPPALQTIPTGEYTGNAVDAIDVFNQSQVQIDETFRAHGVPYLLQNGFAMIPEANSGPITLTLEAGVRLLFPRNESGVLAMNLGQSSGMLDSDQRTVRLVAQGTEDGPIVLTSAEEAPSAGDWGGVFWAAGPATGNAIDYMRIEYAGGDAGIGNFGCGPPDNDAALVITNWRPSEDFIENLTISDSAGGGIVCGWMSDELGPDLTVGNAFTGIANGCNVSRWQDESPPVCPGDGSMPSCL